jgi:hypothetical protein
MILVAQPFPAHMAPRLATAIKTLECLVDLFVDMEEEAKTRNNMLLAEVLGNQADQLGRMRAYLLQRGGGAF